MKNVAFSRFHERPHQVYDGYRTPSPAFGSLKVSIRTAHIGSIVSTLESPKKIPCWICPVSATTNNSKGSSAFNRQGAGYHHA